MEFTINHQTINIRTERENDHRIVEQMTRQAFWNIYEPGCVEHFLVHIMRSHPDFLPQLDLVAELNGEIIGNVMYTKAKLINELGQIKPILTFGPISIRTDHQRQGFGKALLKESFRRAKDLGYDTIVIFGMPSNYVSSGFRSCAKYQVSLKDGTYPAAMLVKELSANTLQGHQWTYQESPVMENLANEDIQKFDQGFEPMKKSWQPSQEEFYILSRATIK